MGLLDLFKKKEAPKSAPRPGPRPGPGASALGPRPDPRAENNFVLAIINSCQYDTFMTAEPKTILKLGKPKKRYSYAS